jgi:hypothetical protein
LDGGQIQGKDNFLKKEMETALEPLTWNNKSILLQSVQWF